MENVVLEVYLFFTGNCREAMEFYRKVFGGGLTIQTYGEAPGMADVKDPSKIMHASLRNEDIHLMASDSTRRDSFGESFISLSLGGSDKEKLTSLFDKLAEGGEVKMPLKKQMWGDLFGELTDQFGVDWMVNITEQPK